MQRRHSLFWPLLALAVLAVGAVHVSAAHAQGNSAKAIFEKYNLLGTSAFDCTKPASKNNNYFVHRAVDAQNIQRDMMEGPTERGWVVMINDVSETRPNEILIAGTRQGRPFNSTYRVEPNRMRVMESTVDGKLIITGGRLVNGGEIPWTNKCGN